MNQTKGAADSHPWQPWLWLRSFWYSLFYRLSMVLILQVLEKSQVSPDLLKCLRRQ